MFREKKIGEGLRKYSQILLSRAMIIAKSKKDLDKMREVGELIAEVRETLRGMVEPGITTLELNQVAEKMMRDAGAIPAFIGYAPAGLTPYPFAICASVNEQVVHGFSTDKKLIEGDILSIDMAAKYNGFVGDTATTIPIGKVSDEVAQLIKITEKCLARAIEQCRPNKRIGDISWAVQELADQHGYGIVRNYTGHGIGRSMHESPSIPNYGRPGTKERIRAGFCFALEPMLTLGTHETKTLEDGWTVITADKKYAAHAEHTIAVTAEGPEILTLTREQKVNLKADKKETASA